MTLHIVLATSLNLRAEAGNLRALEAEAMRLVASQTGAIDAFIQGAWK
jgi:hypothetical protein